MSGYILSECLPARYYKRASLEHIRVRVNLFQLSNVFLVSQMVIAPVLRYRTTDN